MCVSPPAPPKTLAALPVKSPPEGPPKAPPKGLGPGTAVPKPPPKGPERPGPAPVLPKPPPKGMEAYTAISYNEAKQAGTLPESPKQLLPQSKQKGMKIGGTTVMNPENLPEVNEEAESAQVDADEPGNGIIQREINKEKEKLAWAHEKLRKEKAKLAGYEEEIRKEKAKLAGPLPHWCESATTSRAVEASSSAQNNEFGRDRRRPTQNQHKTAKPAETRRETNTKPAQNSETGRDQLKTSAKHVKLCNKTAKLAESPKPNNTKQNAASAAEASRKYIKHC